jgi:hypothetical protein
MNYGLTLGFVEVIEEAIGGVHGVIGHIAILGTASDLELWVCP